VVGEPTSSTRRSVTSRLIELAKRLSDFPPESWRTPLLLIAAGVFLIGGAFAVMRSDITWSELRWTALVAAAVIGVPATLMVNALEFQLSARAIGSRVGLLDASRIAVTASAANLLPIPGGALVRIQALRQSGHAYRHAVSATLAIGVAWVAVAFLGAGLVVTARSPGPGVILTAIGAALLLATLALARVAFVPGRRARLVIAVLGVEILSVVVGAARLHLILIAVGADLGWATPMLLTLATVVSAAIGIAPSGLGLREALGGLLAPIGGATASLGFSASAIDRVISLFVIGPIAVGLAFAGRRRRASPPARASLTD
jgi:uncharacterized membrane protein YbhN (UPF0104 family)